MIEVKNIHKSFDGVEVLKGISTTFEKGKTNLIIGQSGSGKTVFLKCLLGLFEYEEGCISYDGKIFSELSEDEIIRDWSIDEKDKDFVKTTK